MAHVLKTSAGLRPKRESVARQAGAARHGVAERGGPPTVAVVICAHTEDRWDEMVFAVTSVMQQTHRAAEILLVIDHNPALLRRATFELRGVVAIPNEHAQGLSGARNTGVRAASSDIVAFLDDGAFAAPNWLAALVAPYADPDVLGVGGRVVPAWRTGRPAWFPAEFDWVVGCSYRGMPTERTPLRSYLCANMSLRRQLLLQGGGLDGTELSTGVQRRRPRGSHVYEPAAIVRLGIPPSVSSWSYFRSRCFSAGMFTALVVGDRVGADSRSETAYLRTVIPKGIGRSVVAALRGDPTAAHAALVLGAGAAVTSAGYAIGWSRAAWDRVARQRSASRPSNHSAQQSGSQSHRAVGYPTAALLQR